MAVALQWPFVEETSTTCVPDAPSWISLSSFGRRRIGDRCVACIFSYAPAQNWSIISPYALNEVLRNLAKLPATATTDWLRLRLQLIVVDDVVMPRLSFLTLLHVPEMQAAAHLKPSRCGARGKCWI
jgi:hypothetical protein